MKRIVERIYIKYEKNYSSDKHLIGFVNQVNMCVNLYYQELYYFVEESDLQIRSYEIKTLITVYEQSKNSDRSTDSYDKIKEYCEEFDIIKYSHINTVKDLELFKQTHPLNKISKWKKQ